VNRADCAAPTYAHLRPFKSGRPAAFPIYSDLVKTLLTAEQHPDATIAHVMAVCSAYAYADIETVATMLARMGLEGNRCVMIEEYVDAMFITSTSFLTQSRDGRVVILGYRGTPATSLITWLTDANLEPTRIRIPSPSGTREGDVHGGFYRNVRSTKYEILNALERAINGQSIRPHDDEQLESGMEALYITGHSLGAASAAMLALMLVVDSDYGPIREKLKAVYTFGGPMIASREIAEDCDRHPLLRERVIRYVYDNDIIPQLPPKESGAYAHFGVGYQYKPKQKNWEHNDAPRKQLGDLLKLAASPLTLFAGDLKLTGRLQFHASLRDHLPQYYLAALTPPGIRSEFGD
jgi:lipase (class 3)